MLAGQRVGSHRGQSEGSQTAQSEEFESGAVWETKRAEEKGSGLLLRKLWAAALPADRRAARVTGSLGAGSCKVLMAPAARALLVKLQKHRLLPCFYRRIEVRVQTGTVFSSGVRLRLLIKDVGSQTCVPFGRDKEEVIEDTNMFCCVHVACEECKASAAIAAPRAATRVPQHITLLQAACWFGVSYHCRAAGKRSLPHSFRSSGVIAFQWKLSAPSNYPVLYGIGPGSHAASTELSVQIDSPGQSPCSRQGNAWIF